MRDLEIIVADITTLRVAAIVNAANETLLGGGGVDGAIHAAAGPELLAACRQLPQTRPNVRCPTGTARVTPGFRLPADWVVHTVGPVWQGGTENEAQLLASCYRTCLAIADAYELRSVAFPAISAGAYGYPRDEAASIAIRVLRTASDHIERIIVCCYDDAMRQVYEQALGA